MASNKRGYDIGFRKPPAAHQFQKGQSGNPKGRPKGAKNLATILEKAVNERVVITENGKRRTATKLEVTVKQLVNKAATGDRASTSHLIALVDLIETRAQNRPLPGSILGPEDQIVIESLMSRLQGVKKKE